MLKRILLLIGLLGIIGYSIMAISIPSSYAMRDSEIDEASGLAASPIHPEILYTHNDSGGKNAIYLLSTQGETRGKLILEGIKNRDWEDIATCYDAKSKQSYIYVAEIGDNRAKYPSVFVYRFKEPQLLPEKDFMLNIEEIERLEIVYEDGARDAEALFVDPLTMDMYIISKREDSVGVYQIKYPQSISSINTAFRVATLPLSMVTAADISPDGKKILIKTYTGIWQITKKRGQSITQALQNRMKDRPYKVEPQGEAVAWDSKGKGYYTLSEVNPDYPLFLYYYK